ncbi:MAG: leucine-rich repeat protein [Spirochaetaceae bacterium]|nr:leucine-rich repeat protein [Spirochaetaceae bacterium]
MRYILAFILLSVLAAAPVFGQEVEDFEYRTEIYNGNIGIAVVGYNGKAREVVIPALIRGFPVTVIDDGAFKNKSLTFVEIPNTVRKIGKEAFAGNKLDDVAIPKNLTEIENNSFDANLLVNVPELGEKIGKKPRPPVRRTAVAQAEQEKEDEAPPALTDAAADFAPEEAVKTAVELKKTDARGKTAAEPVVETRFNDKEDWNDYNEPEELAAAKREPVNIESKPASAGYGKESAPKVLERNILNEPTASRFDAPDSAYPASPPQTPTPYQYSSQTASRTDAYNQAPPPQNQGAYQNAPPDYEARSAPSVYRQEERSVYQAPPPRNQEVYQNAPPDYEGRSAPSVYRQEERTVYQAPPPRSQEVYRQAPSQTARQAPSPAVSSQQPRPQVAQTVPAQNVQYPAPSSVYSQPQASAPVYAARQTIPAAPKGEKQAFEEWVFTAGRNGSASLAGYTGIKKILILPFSVNGFKITAVEPFSFSKKSIQSVTFPSALSSIGDGAFSSNKISDVIIPVSIRAIGYGAFEDNPLRRIKISAAVNLQENSFPYGFANFYNFCGKKAGTYSFSNGSWEYVAFDKLAYDSM